MRLPRILRHLITPHRVIDRAFPQRVREVVEAAVSEAEKTHEIQLRIVAEAGLPLRSLLRGEIPRVRAIELFSRLRVWDTEHHSGVLIYVQMAGRKIEIVADRGINAKVKQAEWNAICRRITHAFREGRFEEGAMVGIREVTELIKQHIPPRNP